MGAVVVYCPSTGSVVGQRDTLGTRYCSLMTFSLLCWARASNCFNKFCIPSEFEVMRVGWPSWVRLRSHHPPAVAAFARMITQRPHRLTRSVGIPQSTQMCVCAVVYADTKLSALAPGLTCLPKPPRP